MNRVSKKPTGRLGIFYDYLGTVTDDPAGEIEELALLCLYNGKINRKRYITLQYRTPFHDYERETLGNLGKKLKLSQERVRQLESSATRKIKRKYESIQALK